MAKRASSAYRRTLLHKDKLIFFKHWVLLPAQGYIEMPKTAHKWEVLRIRKWDPHGNDNPDIFFYLKDPPTQHVTLDALGELLVKKWLRSKRPPKNRRDKYEKTYERRFELLESVHMGNTGIRQYLAQMKDMGFSKSEAEDYLGGDDSP